MIRNLETMDELSDRWKVEKSWLYRQTRRSDEDAIPKIKIGKYIRFEPEKVDRWLMSQQNQ